MRHRGSFGCRVDRSDGLDLRDLRWAGEAVADRIYVAVRDPWWRTIPLRVIRRQEHATTNGFEIAADAVTASDAHPLAVTLRYRAAGDVLTVDFEGTAEEDFDYARIGLCALLSDAVVGGRDATSWDALGVTSFTFPRAILAPDRRTPEADAFHRPFSRLRYTLPSGPEVELAFQGGSFELEDQRNWTDPSYKIYSAAPVGGPRFTALAGQRFAQRLRLGVRGGARTDALSAQTAAPVDPQPHRLRLGRPVGHLASIGVFRGRESECSLRPSAGFAELNARRPDATGCDMVELGVNGSVHAADDDSVLEATRTHGQLVAQARATYPGLPVVLAPVAFAEVAGDWRDEAGAYVPEPPPEMPGTDDPRRRTGYAATWVLASVAAAAAAGATALRYLDQTLPAASPASEALTRLGRLEGQHVLQVSVPVPLLALAVSDGTGVVLAIANTGPDATEVQLPDGSTARVDGFGSLWRELSGAG